MFYKDVESFCAEIIETYNESENGIAVVGYYDEIAEVLNELAQYENLYLYDICLIPDGGTYILTVDNDGDISVDVACCDCKGFQVEPNWTTFVFEDINSKFWINNPDADLVEVDFDVDSEECDGNCEHCTECEDNDDEIDVNVVIDAIKDFLTR